VVSGFITAAPFNAMARGAKVILAGDKGYAASTGCAYMSFMARKELVESGKLKNPAQLKGRRVVMFRDSNAAGYCTDKILEMGGLTFNDIEIVNLPNAARPEALRKGAIDLFLAFEPWVTITTQTGQGVIWVPAQQIIPDFPTAPLIFGPSIADKNRDAGRRFMVAYLKGVRQYNLGKTERNLEIITKYTGMDRELLKKLCWPPIRDTGMINVESMMDFQKWAVKRGFLDKVVPQNQFWDPSFIEYANKILSSEKK
jgi:NitT/TauT family transport system substrate-binding protein